MNARDGCTCEDFCVRDHVLPLDAQNNPQTFCMEVLLVNQDITIAFMYSTGVQIVDCHMLDIAIASICHATATACHSEGCIRVPILDGGVQIAACCLHYMEIASI